MSVDRNLPPAESHCKYADYETRLILRRGKGDLRDQGPAII
jgi:hypothetical protein